MAGTRATDHKEGKATVKAVYYTHKTLADGSHPFVIRITKNRKNRWISTGDSLHPKYWNEQKQEIRRNYPEHLREALQKKLRALVEKYEAAANTLAEADEQHDAGAVAAKAVESRKQARRTTLLAYIDTIIEDMVTSRKTGNSVVYRDVRNQLAKFIQDEYGVADVSFDKVTVSFCHEWERTLRATGIADTTLNLRFRTLRAVLNRAIANQYAKPEHYPFARNVAEKHKFSVSKFDTTTQKRAVSREAIRAVENFEPTGQYTAQDFPKVRNPNAVAKIKNAAEIDRLVRAKDIFLFSFYVAGINFVDIAKLRWQDLSIDEAGNYRIGYVRQKTGGKFSLKLVAPAVAIVERYRRETYTGPAAHIFPILDNVRHLTTEQVNNRLHKIMGQTNTDLKTIGKAIGLATPLTTYVARHSFATNLKRAGHASAVIGQALGHKDEATTNIYLDSFGSDAVDAAFDSLL